MHLRKFRLAVLAMFCGVALVATVSPTRAETRVEDEPRLQSSKNVTALDALGATDDSDSSTPTATPSDTNSPAVSEKPQAPAPKIPTDSDAAKQSGPGSRENPSQQKPAGPPSNPTGQQDENPKRI